MKQTKQSELLKNWEAEIWKEDFLDTPCSNAIQLIEKLLQAKDAEAAELVEAERNRAKAYLEKGCWSKEDIEAFLRWGKGQDFKPTNHE